MRNACLDAALAELDAVGIRDYQVARGGKHLQLRWSVAGHALRVLTLPLTPSDWRSPQNTRSDLRKLLRQDGLLERNGAHPPVKPDPDLWRQQLSGASSLLPCASYSIVPSTRRTAMTMLKWRQISSSYFDAQGSRAVGG